ncbi:MAG: nucleotidyl transferase AbiEii/AbiGii toxin family protein [Thermoplasmata archaeon]|nr:nucleotidyl transferase AbiEii/AbiGii toxin family protein [Thermoplasmata archaeon]
MRPNVDPAVRERSVLALLDDWPWKLGGVLIGGYALAAYDRPRYSEDVDVVVPVGRAAELEEWISDRSYRLEKSFTVAPRTSRGEGPPLEQGRGHGGPPHRLGEGPSSRGRCP